MIETRKKICHGPGVVAGRSVPKDILDAKKKVVRGAGSLS